MEAMLRGVLRATADGSITSGGQRVATASSSSCRLAAPGRSRVAVSSTRHPCCPAAGQQHCAAPVGTPSKARPHIPTRLRTTGHPCPRARQQLAAARCFHPGAPCRAVRPPAPPARAAAAAAYSQPSAGMTFAVA